MDNSCKLAADEIPVFLLLSIFTTCKTKCLCNNFSWVQALCYPNYPLGMGIDDSSGRDPNHNSLFNLPHFQTLTLELILTTLKLNSFTPKHALHESHFHPCTIHALKSTHPPFILATLILAENFRHGKSGIASLFVNKIRVEAALFCR